MSKDFRGAKRLPRLDVFALTATNCLKISRSIWWNNKGSSFLWNTAYITLLLSCIL